MNDMQKEIFARLDALAEKLGVAAGHLWEIMVRQAYLEGVATLVLGFLLLGVTAWCYRYCKRADADSEGVATCWMVGFGAGLVGMAALHRGFLAVANPQYAALRKLMELVN